MSYTALTFAGWKDSESACGVRASRVAPWYAAWPVTPT